MHPAECFWVVYILEVSNRIGVVRELRNAYSKNEPLKSFLKVVDKPPFMIPGPIAPWHLQIGILPSIKDAEPHCYVFRNEFKAYEAASRYANIGAFPVVLNGLLGFEENFRYLSKEEREKLKQHQDYFYAFHDFVFESWR